MLKDYQLKIQKKFLKNYAKQGIFNKLTYSTTF